MTAPMRARDPDEIRAAMKARGGLTNRELGALARTTYGTISFILAGKAVTRDVAKRIARSLRRGVDDLFVAATANDKRDNVQQDADEDAA